MGLGTKYGPGSGARGRGSALTVQAPPTNPQSGSGGPGILRGLGDTGRSGIVVPSTSDVSAAMTGRITLGMVEIVIVAMLGFYYWTRSAQGGG